jgi:hypothetical protein
VHESWNKKLPSLVQDEGLVRRQLTPCDDKNPYAAQKHSEEASFYTYKFLSRPESINDPKKAANND